MCEQRAALITYTEQPIRQGGLENPWEGMVAGVESILGRFRARSRSRLALAYFTRRWIRECNVEGWAQPPTAFYQALEAWNGRNGGGPGRPTTPG